MRDPDLRDRAERAAIALERAWIHWQQRHGLRGNPLPPVSSYVGYSLEEPWGQPRVVLGVAADQAERLASILEGHECVGPVHATLASRADSERQADGRSAAVGQAMNDAHMAVPWQMPRFPSGYGGPAQPGAAGLIPAQPAAPYDEQPRVAPYVEQYVEDDVADEFGAMAPDQWTVEELRTPQPLSPLPAPLPETLPEDAAIADLPPEPPSEQAEKPVRPAPRRTKSVRLTAKNLKQAEPEPLDVPDAEAPTETEEPPTVARNPRPPVQRTKARLRQVSKLNRTRKPAPAAPDGENPPEAEDQPIAQDRPGPVDELASEGQVAPEDQLASEDQLALQDQQESADTTS